MESSAQRVLVLGSASWLGYLLLNRLHEVNPYVKLAGTFHLQQVDFKFGVALHKAEEIYDYQRVLQDYEPTVVINFLRGEDLEGLAIHRHVLDYCKSNDCYYLFASSALALDSYKNRELTEDTLANSASPYGRFKAACEVELYQSTSRWCIIRFASVQGWVPHKITRNESLLRKLQRGERIFVDRGVVQNRMLADLLVDGVAKLIGKEVQGIIHFGTIDRSEEFDYLRKQAECFGYNADLVRSGNDRNVNLATIPGRILELFGKDYEVTENDTLAKLVQLPGLHQYKMNLKL